MDKSRLSKKATFVFLRAGFYSANQSNSKTSD